MKNKILLEVIIVLSVVFLVQRSFIKETSFLSPAEEENIVKVQDTKTKDIATYKMEEYLVGVLAGEMPASFEEEALKAQAIASRTFAYYKVGTSSLEYDLTNDLTSQVHITDEQMQLKWGEEYEYYLERIKKAILATKDMVLTYKGEVISSYYYSMSNGYTENAELVFNIPKDYLKSVESKEDIENENFQVTKIMSIRDFCQKLGINCDPGIVIENLERTSAKRVKSIRINGIDFIGTDVRRLLDLRSTDFDIEIENDVYITTRGYGHGVGMSQYGAQYMASSGYTYEDILKHYYQNVEIQNINSIK